MDGPEENGRRPLIRANSIILLDGFVIGFASSQQPPSSQPVDSYKGAQRLLATRGRLRERVTSGRVLATHGAPMGAFHLSTVSTVSTVSGRHRGRLVRMAFVPSKRVCADLHNNKFDNDKFEYDLN